MTGPLFNNNNSIFSSPFQSQNSNDRLNQLYQEMEFMKQHQTNQQQRTVFTDIAEEMKDVSVDERRFIETSDEYLSASQEYQNYFTLFLIDFLGADFLNSRYGKSPEKVLAVIRQKKDDYKNRFAENISEIRSQNNTLAQQNDALAQANMELQKQLADIRKQLGGMTNANS